MQQVLSFKEKFLFSMCKHVNTFHYSHVLAHIMLHTSNLEHNAMP
jgi:hypothetical protein